MKDLPLPMLDNLLQVGGLWGVVAAGFTVDDAARVDLDFPSEEDGCTPDKQASVNLMMAFVILVYVSKSLTFQSC